MMKHNMLQANYDGNFCYFLVFFPIYLGLVIDNPNIYSVRDMISGSVGMMCDVTGCIVMGLALDNGDGGPIEAI